MILFSTPHQGFFSQITTLRYTKYKHEDCHLMVLSENGILQFEDAMKKEGMFSRVIPFELIKFFDFAKGEVLEKEVLKDTIISYFDSLFEREQIALDQYSELVLGSGGDYDFFSCYCQLKGIHYTFVEQMHAEFSIEHRYGMQELLKGKERIAKELFQETRALTGDKGTACNKRMVHPNGTPLTRENDEVYDFHQEFLEIDREAKNTILEALGLKNKEIRNLLLPCSQSATARLVDTEAEWVASSKIYGYDLLICDLFLDEEVEVTVKPHPVTEKRAIEKNFAAFDILDDSVLIEYFLYKENFMLDMAITASQTTISKLQGRIENLIDYDLFFLRNYHLILKTYCIYHILKELGRKKEVTLIHFPQVMFDTFDSYVLDFRGDGYETGVFSEMKQTKEPVTVLVHPHDEKESYKTYSLIRHLPNKTLPEQEEVNLEDVKKQMLSGHEDSLYIFTEPSILQGDSCFFDETILEHMMVINMTKKQLNIVPLCNYDTEYLFVFSRSTKIRADITNITLERNFHRAGLQLSILARSNAERHTEFEQWKVRMKESSIPKEKIKFKIRQKETIPQCYEGKTIVLWGAGYFGEIFIESLRKYDVKLSAFCDNNEKRWGSMLHEVPIISPEDLVEMQKIDSNLLLQISCYAKNEIEVRKQAEELGILNILSVGDGLEQLELY